MVLEMINKLSKIDDTNNYNVFMAMTNDKKIRY